MVERVQESDEYNKDCLHLQAIRQQLDDEELKEPLDEIE